MVKPFNPRGLSLTGVRQSKIYKSLLWSKGLIKSKEHGANSIKIAIFGVNMAASH